MLYNNVIRSVVGGLIMSNEDYWKIKEFAALVNRCHLEKFPEDKPLHQNSIDKWFKDMEEQRIHYVQRSPIRKEWKIYDQLDLEIALFIMEMRSKANGAAWNVSAIYPMIEARWETRPFPDDYEGSFEVMDFNKALEHLTKEMNVQLKVQLQEILQEQEKNRTLLIEEGFDRHNEKTKELMVDLFERQTKLKKEAAAEWEKQPDEKKYIKKLFRKEENWKEREKFIDDYVEKNMWKGLAKGE